MKGSDENTFLMLFSLISKTLSDNVDDETSRMISDYIHRLIVECAEKEGYSEDDIVSFIKTHMQRLMKTESYDLPLISKYCGDYSSITKMLNLANNNYNILEFILKIVNVPLAERNTYLKEYLNELLAKPNSVEIDTYNEIEYNELVIKMGGDVEGAKAKFEEELAHREEEFNIISTIINWVYDFANENVNGQMRLNMFTLIKTFQQKAADLYISNYRSMYKTVHPIRILDYSTDANLANESGEISKVEELYETKQREELSTIKNFPAYISFGVGAACGVVAFFVHLLLLAGTGVGVAIGIGILISNKYKCKNIILKNKSQKENVLEILHRLVAEHAKMKELYDGFDGISDRVLEELAKL